MGTIFSCGLITFGAMVSIFSSQITSACHTGNFYCKKEIACIIKWLIKIYATDVYRREERS